MIFEQNLEPITYKNTSMLVHLFHPLDPKISQLTYSPHYNIIQSSKRPTTYLQFLNIYFPLLRNFFHNIDKHGLNIISSLC